MLPSLLIYDVKLFNSSSINNEYLKLVDTMSEYDNIYLLY